MTTATIKKQIMKSNMVCGFKNYKCSKLLNWKTAALDVFIILCIVIGH